VKRDLVRMCSLEGDHRLVLRITERDGPRRPAPDRGVTVAYVPVDRFVQREAAERLALRAAILAKGARPRRARGQMAIAEMRVQPLERPHLDARHARVIDQRLGTERGELALHGVRFDFPTQVVAFSVLRHFGHRDIEDVQKLARGGAVGTRLRGVRAEERVQRVDAHEVGPATRRMLDELSQVGEIPDAPVALRAERVELGREAPRPLSGPQPPGLEAALRCHDQHAVGRRQRVDRRAKLVIAAGNCVGEDQKPSRQLLAADLGALALSERARERGALDRATAVEPHVPGDVPVEKVDRQCKRDTHAARPQHCDGGASVCQRAVSSASISRSSAGASCS
jgi:hypothetical protein